MATPEQSTETEHRYFDMDTANAAPMGPEHAEHTVGEDGDPELRGIRHIKLAALLGVIGILFILVVPIGILFGTGIGLNLAGAANGSAANAVTVFGIIEAAVVLLVLGALLLVVSFGIYVSGFANLRKAAPKFTGPLVLSIIGLIGLLMITGGFGLILSVFLQVATCGGVGHVTVGCLNTDPIGVGAILILGGILPALIGWIGLVLGLYRTGSRYSSSMTKIGAILYIIPMLNVVAPLLVWLGAREIEKVLLQPVAPAAPMMSPPA